jgi:hypothetical protein
MSQRLPVRASRPGCACITEDRVDVDKASHFIKIVLRVLASRFHELGRRRLIK